MRNACGDTMRVKLLIGKGFFDRSMVNDTCTLFFDNKVQCVDLTDNSGDCIVFDGFEDKWVEVIIHRRRRRDLK